MPLSKWKVIRQFLNSEKREPIGELHPSYPARKTCRALSLSDDPITVRLVRLELDDGQVSVFVTSLVDCQAFDHSLFQDLYSHRWPVEDDYRQMKVRLEVENWTGTSVEAIYQDFVLVITYIERQRVYGLSNKE